MKRNFIKLIEKIKLKISNIFNKNQVKLLEASSENDNVENLEPKTQEEQQTQFENIELEKKRIFDLYQRIKDNSVELETISKQDLIKVRELFKEELKFYIRKNEEEKHKINILTTEINEMRYKLRNLVKRI